MRWRYDHAGRQISASRLVAGREQASHTRYDELGRKLAEWDWMAQQTSYQYDVANRLLKKTAPFDHREAVTLHYYDPAGQMLRQKVATEGGHIETAYTYDARGRQTAVTHYEDEAKQKWHRSHMAYDAVGNLLETRQGENHQNSVVTVTRTSYNRFGKPITVTDALGQTESHRYGPTGLLLEKTDRNGSVTSFRYDALDRLIGKSVTVNGRTDSEETAYTRAGAVARKIGRAAGQEPLEIVYRYDASGRVVKQTDPGRVSKEYSYNACGRKTHFLLYREGALEIDLAYVYDEVGRLTEVKRTREVLAHYGYDENGRRTRVSYPAAGLETQTSYNPGGLPTQMRYLKNGLLNEYVTYEYSPCGNRVGKTEDGRSTQYSYDRLGRLRKEAEESALDGNFRRCTEYGYDAWQNRTHCLVKEDGRPDILTQYEHDKNNRLLKETVICGKKTETYRYEYDKNGNQRYREWSATEPKCSGKGYGYIGFARELEGPVAIDERRYDGFGRLLEVYRDGMRAEYRTRPDGLRHQKTVRTPRGLETATLHCWDGQSIVLDTRAEGDSQVVKARYFRGSGLIAQQLEGKLYYYQHNAHGDVTRRVCEDGNAAPKYQYDAFGNQRTDDATDPNPFRYCGEYYDKELGEVYLRARQYDPRTGRFTSEDPAKDGGNWYAYGKNNPVKYVDPTGLKSYEAYANGKWVSVPERYLGDFKQWRIVDEKGTYNYKRGQGGKYTPTKRGNTTAPSGGPTLLPPPKFSYGNLNSFGSNATMGGLDGRGGYTPLSNFQLANDKDTPHTNKKINPKIPPNPESGYRPPKKGGARQVQNPNGPGEGWLSRDGSVWVPKQNQHGGVGWTEQFPGGRHRHRHPNGHVRDHISGEQVVGGLIVVAAFVAIAWVLLNDATGIGVVDDPLLAPLVYLFQQGMQMATAG